MALPVSVVESPSANMVVKSEPQDAGIGVPDARWPEVESGAGGGGSGGGLNAATTDKRARPITTAANCQADTIFFFIERECGGWVWAYL